MELKEFIKETIVQITDGLREGHKYIQDNKFGSGVKDDMYEEIHFNVAVSTNDEEKTALGGKICVANIFNAGAKDESTSNASNVSRIEFKISLHVKTSQ